MRLIEPACHSSGNRGRSFRAFLTGWLIYDGGYGMLRLERQGFFLV